MWKWKWKLGKVEVFSCSAQLDIGTWNLDCAHVERIPPLPHGPRDSRLLCCQLIQSTVPNCSLSF